MTKDNQTQALLIALKEEAYTWYREIASNPSKVTKDLNLAFQSDFCRFVIILIHRVEKRNFWRDSTPERKGKE